MGLGCEECQGEARKWGQVPDGEATGRAMDFVVRVAEVPEGA